MPLTWVLGHTEQNMRLLPLLGITAALLVGCANPINERTAQNYWAAGEEALRSGNLPLARENFRRTLINVQVGNLGPVYEAQAAAKLARVEGNLCEYEEADKTFQYALSSKMKAVGENSPATFPLRIELAQLSFDTGHFNKSIEYFERAFAVGGSTLESKDPADYAAMLDDYATALASTGKPAEAELARARSSALRKSAGAMPSNSKGKSDYVPYPKSCK